MGGDLYAHTHAIRLLYFYVITKRNYELHKSIVPMVEM